MKYTAKDIKVGTKMTCIDNNDTPWWTNGKIYEVKKSKLPKSGICIIDDQGSERYLEGILARLHNGSTGVKFEIVEEEKEMKKYAKITKYFGRYNTDKRNGLEIGKEYEIVRFSDVSEDCWIYLDDKRPEYFISEKQYELVDEQQENPLVEMQQKLNDKIKLLKEERGRIIDKIERLDKHQRALKSKIDRLSDAEDALKILKDFK